MTLSGPLADALESIEQTAMYQEAAAAWHLLPPEARGWIVGGGVAFAIFSLIATRLFFPGLIRVIRALRSRRRVPPPSNDDET